MTSLNRRITMSGYGRENRLVMGVACVLFVLAMIVEVYL